MQAIEHHRFGNLRTLVVEGEPWFCAKDLAAALDYSDPRRAVAQHVKEKHNALTRLYKPF
jgi:prophage antirepressor-like protein